MKKVLFVLVGLAFAGSVFAQNTPTIVSTDVQKRNVVMEEYTGIGCGYCPSGHANVNKYAKLHQGRVVSINIHQGGYAQGYKPNYTTQWGNALANQADITGYPAGVLNRQRVTNTTADNYGALINVGPSSTDWYSSANTILSQESPVNVAATATIDAKTRTLNVHVEVYYTKTTQAYTNLLNIALLQNNVEGDQHNYGGLGSLFNAEYVLYPYSDYTSSYNTRYLHMHMLRDLITGKWGDTIAKSNTDGNIPAGTFFSKDYIYQIPEYYTDAMYNSNTQVPCIFGDIELAVFVTEGLQQSEHWEYELVSQGKKYKISGDVIAPNIYTGISVDPQYTNMEEPNVMLRNVSFNPVYGCKDLATMKVRIRNIAKDTITSIKFEYTNAVASDTKTFTWMGSLPIFEEQDVDITEPITVTTGTNSSVKVKVIELNGQAIANSIEKTASYYKTPVKEGKGYPKFIIKTDKKASQISWTISDAEGNILQQSSGYANGKLIRDTVVLDQIKNVGCVVFEIKDTGKDGASDGMYKIVDATGRELISNTKGNWGEGEKKEFKISEIVGLNDANENIYQSIVYPNPSQDITTLSISLVNSDNAKISVVDATGRTVIDMGTQNLHGGENQLQINTSNLANGIYYIRVITNNGMTANKFSIIK